MTINSIGSTDKKLESNTNKNEIYMVSEKLQAEIGTVEGISNILYE